MIKPSFSWKVEPETTCNHQVPSLSDLPHFLSKLSRSRQENTTKLCSTSVYDDSALSLTRQGRITDNPRLFGGKGPKPQAKHGRSQPQGEPPEAHHVFLLFLSG